MSALQHENKENTIKQKELDIFELKNQIED
jgi:hypothetical protein